MSRKVECTGKFESPIGSFSLEWEFFALQEGETEADERFRLTYSMEGSAYHGIGWGRAMVESDMVIGWVDAEGVGHVKDYIATAPDTPFEDTLWLGEDNLENVTATRGEDGTTTISFIRLMRTGDFSPFLTHPIDKNMTRGPMDMIYAWAPGAPGDLTVRHDERYHTITPDFSICTGEVQKEETGLSDDSATGLQISAALLAIFLLGIYLLPRKLGRGSASAGMSLGSKVGRKPLLHAALVAGAFLIAVCASLLFAAAIPNADLADENIGAPYSWATDLTPDIVAYYGFVLATSVFLFLNNVGPNNPLSFLHKRAYLLGFHTIGEAIVVLAFCGYVVWHTWWWYNDVGIAAISAAVGPVEQWARALGHTNQVTMALLFLPVTRNSVWHALFGIPFERAIKYHRWLGRLLFVGVVAHLATWIRVWSIQGMVEACLWFGQGDGTCRHTAISVWTGEVAFLSILVTAVTAYEAVRRKAFEAFYYTHLVLLGLTVTMACAHTLLASGSPPRGNLVKYLMLGAILYVVDLLQRSLGNKATVTEITPLAGNVTRLQVSKPRGFHYRAGQYCFVKLPGFSMAQWHPFTISSSPSEDDDVDGGGSHTLTFHIKAMNANGFTGWLHKQALAFSEGLEQSSLPAIRIDGPYGSPPDLCEYEAALLVAGGVGITPIMSTFLSLLDQAEHGQLQGTPLKDVRLVWCVRDVDQLTWFAQQLGMYDDNAGFGGSFSHGGEGQGGEMGQAGAKGSAGFNVRKQGVHFAAYFYVSDGGMRARGRGSTHSINSAGNEPLLPAAAAENVGPLPEHQIGRPNIPVLLDALAKAHPRGACATFVCGPDTMKTSTMGAAAKYSNVRAHVETFFL